MKGKYKRKMVWCYNCDSQLVEVGVKCKNCGHREYAPKIKKPSQYRIKLLVTI